MIHVLYVIPGLGGTGGAERSLAALVPFWKDQIDLHIVTLSDRAQLSGEIESHGVRLTRLTGGAIRKMLALRRLVKVEHPDLVHTTLFDADVIGRIATIGMRTPLSCSLVNVNYGPDQAESPNINRIKLRLAQMVDAVTARRVTKFHALTENVASVMSRALLVPKQRITVIGRGRDPAVLGVVTPERRAMVRMSLGLAEERVVLVAARHEYQKGVDVVAEAFSAVVEFHPDAVLLIAGGEGSETKKIRDIVGAGQLNGHVRFLGARDDIPDLMAAADLFCVPSRWEGFASIMTEAMGLGVVTLASDIPTLREVGGEPAWCNFARSDDPEAWAKGINRMLDRVAAGELVENQRSAQHRFAENWTALQVAAAMERFFTGVAACCLERTPRFPKVRMRFGVRQREQDRTNFCMDSDAGRVRTDL